MRATKIAMVGDFDRRRPSHWATEAALFHAAVRLGVTLEPHWVGTHALTGADAGERLGAFDGIWGAPGSPYAALDGMLNAIRFARERNIPYLGTCGGFQSAVIEFSRNVLGIADADSAENASESRNIVIRPISCEVTRAAPGTPRLAGPGVARPVPGTLVAELCGCRVLEEEYFCSFELEAEFVSRWLQAGMVIAAEGQSGEVRALQLRAHPFFLATLFQPQLSSSGERPHPIVEGFLRASALSARARAGDS
jgi:CTP synthase (UTP-ammonia lyase)